MQKSQLQLPTAPKNQRTGTPTPLAETLDRFGISNPESLNTKQASIYLSQIKGIPTAKGTLEVYRCQSRGPKYKKIRSRVFYTIQWLDEWASGVEVKIFDPSCN